MLSMEHYLLAREDMLAIRLNFIWHVECFHHCWTSDSSLEPKRIYVVTDASSKILAARRRLALQPSNTEVLRTNVLLHCALKWFCRSEQQSILERVVTVAVLDEVHQKFEEET